MFEDDPIDRRTVLRRAGAAAIASVAFAGCSAPSNDGGGGDGGSDGGGASTTTSGNTDFGGWMEDAKNYDGSVADETGSDEVIVTVGAGSSGFAFGPAAVRVSTGTTVKWKWTGEGGQHNVRAKEGASFESDLYKDAGVHFTRIFEEAGMVMYQCDPHSTVGMKGAVVVE